MSKWKTVRKTNLKRYRDYEQADGILFGCFLGAFLAPIVSRCDMSVSLAITLGLFCAYAVHWYLHRNRFTRIRRTIKDAGGENQR